MNTSLEIAGVSKRYGPIQALAGVSLDLRGGEIHALLGENGAGKSTLMHVLYGLIEPDGGSVRLDGREVRPRTPQAVRRLGIGMVHQHFTVVDELTTAENLALALDHPGIRMRPRELERRAVESAARVGIDIGDPGARVGSLSVGARQRIEIVKALAADARVLILDEPTAVLTPGEVAQLFEVLRRLRDEGRLVIFISHKLGEVRQIADRISVLRRGRVAGAGTPGSLSDDALALMMVGETVTASPRGRCAAGAEILQVERVVLNPAVEPQAHIDITVRSGEVFGIAGVDGNGQDELFETLAGLRPPAAGSIRVRGRAVPRYTPAAMMAAGIGVIPPDRRADGLALEMTVAENMTLHRVLLDRRSRRGVLCAAALRSFAHDQAGRYRIRASALGAPAAALSGGNQQRVVVARALAAEPDVLVAVNPARGLDMAASQAVYDLMSAFAAAGKGVILISTDLDEVLELSDRVAVLFRRRLSPTLEPPFPRERIGLMMAGGGGET